MFSDIFTWAFLLNDWLLIAATVFGGCCSNAWSLEALMRQSPNCGALLTFAQFSAVTLYHLPSFVTLSNSYFPRFKPRQVPLYDWAFIVAGFITVNLLNNFAFKYRIPLPIHIVFRSSGLGISMVLGWLVLNRRYSKTQVLCVMAVSFGTLLTTVYAPHTGEHVYHDPEEEAQHVTDYVIGISMLAAALLLSAFMGINQEQLYAKYGSHTWPEMLFYSHSLAIPLIPFFLPTLIPQIRDFNASQSIEVISPLYVPHLHALLIANVVTQFICITGVNRLTAKVSNLSVNLILTLRKAISLLFSIWWYDNGWNAEMSVGTICVLLGSVVFSLVSSQQSRSARKDKL